MATSTPDGLQGGHGGGGRRTQADRPPRGPPGPAPSQPARKAVCPSSSMAARAAARSAGHLPPGLFQQAGAAHHTSTPSTVPRTPSPGTAANPLTAPRSIPSSSAPRATALPTGCSEAASTLPTRYRVRRRSSAVSRERRVIAPRVRVPVLSNTTVSTRRERSKTSAPLKSTPSSAPRPLPTMMAVGVARPRAQGQAMTSTATAACMAAPASPPIAEPQAEGDGGDGQHHRDEDPGDAVGEVLDGGLGGLGLLHQAHDLGQGGLGPHSGGLHHQVAVLVDRGPEHRVPGAPLHRHRLPGEHALVHRRGSLHHPAVGGDALPGSDHHQVAGAHRGDGDAHLDPVATQAGLLGAEFQQAGHRPGGPALGPGLEEAAQQDEGDDDRRRLEVEVLVGEEGPHRVPVGGQGAQRHQGVHARPEGAEALGGVAVELPPEDELHRGGQAPHHGPPAPWSACRRTSR